MVARMAKTAEQASSANKEGEEMASWPSSASNREEGPTKQYQYEPPAQDLDSSSKQNMFPRYTDHTYHDFAAYLKAGGRIEKHKKSDRNFPARLHAILADERYAHIITWMPHGRAWKVLKKDLLVETVIPKYFGQSKFSSFTRQLSGWGFKRLHQTGPDFGCYYHECFLRGHPQLTVLMRRVSPGQGKATKNVHDEPDFHLIAKQFPLEEFTIAAGEAAAATAPKYHPWNYTQTHHHAIDAYQYYGSNANQHIEPKPLGRYHSFPSSSSYKATSGARIEGERRTESLYDYYHTSNPRYSDPYHPSSMQAHQETTMNQYYCANNEHTPGSLHRAAAEHYSPQHPQAQDFQQPHTQHYHDYERYRYRHLYYSQFYNDGRISDQGQVSRMSYPAQEYYNHPPPPNAIVSLYESNFKGWRQQHDDSNQYYKQQP